MYSSFTHDGVEITACGRHSLIKYSGEVKTTDPCNSYAGRDIELIVISDITEYSMSGEAKMIKDTGEDTLIKLYHCITGMFENDKPDRGGSNE